MVKIKHLKRLERPATNLIYKAVKDNADDVGWAYLGAVGGYIANVKPDFDTRNYGYDKLSGLIKALEIFEVKMQGSQMFLRKRSFSTFVKFVQKAIIQHANSNGWANLSDIMNVLEQTDLNVRNYKEAIKSIHSGWIEISEQDNKEMIRTIKTMP